MTERSQSRFFLEAYADTLNRSLAFIAGRIRRNIIPFLLITGLSAGAGVAYWGLRKPYYESEMACSYNNERFTRKTYGELAQKLNLLAQSGSANELSGLLGIPAPLTAAIISVEAKNRVGSPLHEDITSDYQPISITLKATDKRVFAPFQAAIVNYLNSSPYQRDIGAIQVAKIRKKIGYLAADLQKTDSVIDAYTIAIRAGLVFHDTVANHSDITDILNYKNQLEDQITNSEYRLALESGPSVVLMHGFAAPDRPTRGSKKVIAGFALLGLLAALSFVMLRNNKETVYD
jgi:hypothetical protein